MNPSRILIATGLIFLVSLWLGGCAPSSSEDDSLRPAAGLIKDVEIQLTAEKVDKILKVKVSLFNPKSKPITSVQSWLSFDPKALKGTAIDVSHSPFTLTAPFENTFDHYQGIIRIGRANQTPVSDPHIVVAELTFDILEEGTTMMQVYDYRPNLFGHASANVMTKGKPTNVLKKPVSPALIVQ